MGQQLKTRVKQQRRKRWIERKKTAAHLAAAQAKAKAKLKPAPVPAPASAPAPAVASGAAGVPTAAGVPAKA